MSYRWLDIRTTERVTDRMRLRSNCFFFCLLLLSCFNSVWTIKKSGPSACHLISLSSRLACHPETGANEGKCLAKGCCWAPKTSIDPGIPMCFFPSTYSSFSARLISTNASGFSADLKKPKSSFGMDEFLNARVEVRYETKSRARIRLTIPSQPNRWEPPIWLDKPRTDSLPSEVDYQIELIKSPFGLKVYRNNAERTLLIDSSGPMAGSTILADQFLQTTFRLYARHGFGPGEVRNKFPRPLDQWIRMGLWARDVPPMDGTNLYGVHNLFVGIAHDGSAFGIFFLNSNAQEVELTPLPAITYRTIGGIMDFFILTGPSPKNVIRQYYNLVGRPPVPPYWALGYHLCRYGYTNLDEVKQTVQRNIDAGIPIDAQWVDIDYMDAYKIWSTDPIKFTNLGPYINETLHKQYGIKSVLIVDPAVSTKGGSNYLPYWSGLRLGVFINDSRTKQPILGTVWPGETVFPDFSHPNALKWWYDSASQYHQSVPFDGIWIDMNEPASFNWGSTNGCEEHNPLNKPPFVPNILDRALHAKTICPSALHHDTTHYNRHNLYGYDNAKVTHAMMKRLFPGKRPFILTRSSFAGSGRFTSHWTGDNWATWADLRASIAQVIHFNMYAIPMVGADICGFLDDTTEELCIRWHQLGAFYPFARNHNALGSIVQDPAVWSKSGVAAIKEALRLRYLILPYLYTLFFRAHLYGDTVIRALAFEYPEELGTHSISRQMMMGSCILVTPVLDESRTEVDGYVPSGEWINLSTGRREYSKGEIKYFQAPLNVIPVLVRGGCILPMQHNLDRTSISRSKGLSLFVVLNKVDDGSVEAVSRSKARGELFWDDGESDPLDYVRVKFRVSNRTLLIRAFPSTESIVKRLDLTGTSIKVILINGLSRQPTKTYLNGQPTADVTFDESMQTLKLQCPEKMLFTANVTVSWSFDE